MFFTVRASPLACFTQHASGDARTTNAKLRCTLGDRTCSLRNPVSFEMFRNQMQNSQKPGFSRARFARLTQKPGLFGNLLLSCCAFKLYILTIDKKSSPPLPFSPSPPLPLNHHTQLGCTTAYRMQNSQKSGFSPPIRHS